MANMIKIRCKGTSTIPLSSLQNFQGNLKELKEPEYKKLRRSIEKYGFRFPIFVWHKFILDGHQRIFTLNKMVSEGWTCGEIPVVEVEAEDEKEASHLVLLISSRYGHVTDEGLYEFIMTADLNFDELKEEVDLPEIDFKQFEQNFFTEEFKDAEPQIDRAEELNKKWQVKTGDLWQIGEHRLLCGDSEKISDLGRLFNGQEINLLLTDPPYGIDVVKGIRSTVGGSKEVTIGAVRGRRTDTVGKVGGEKIVNSTLYRKVQGDDKPFDPLHLLGTAKHSIIWGGNYFSSKLRDSRCWIVWDKNNTGNFADAELAWTDKDFSSEGETVFDGYAGSGATMLAAENTKRISHCNEIDPAYCAVILERMATAFAGIEIKRIDA